MKQSNEKLLSFAHKKGDRELLMQAYEKIYSDCVKLVSFSVSKYINDNEIIKDITNEVFVSFFNNSINVNNSIKYYLLNTARNLAIQYLEKENKIIKCENIEEIGEYNNFDSHIKYLELIDDLKQVLTENEVRIIVLHVIEGYTFKEIGEKLKVNSKTVNKIYERAIKKYRNNKERV